MNNLLKVLFAVIGIGGTYYYLTSNKKDSKQKENDDKKNKSNKITLTDFPTYAEEETEIKFKKGKKLDLIVTSNNNEIDSFSPNFKNEEELDKWLEILNNEQKDILTKANKKRVRNWLVTNSDYLVEESQELGIKTKSKMLTYFKEELNEEMKQMDRREFVGIVKEYIPSEYLNKEPYKDISKNRRRPKNK